MGSHHDYILDNALIKITCDFIRKMFQIKENLKLLALKVDAFVYKRFQIPVMVI